MMAVRVGAIGCVTVGRVATVPIVLVGRLAILDAHGAAASSIVAIILVAMRDFSQRFFSQKAYLPLSAPITFERLAVRRGLGK